MKFIVLSPRATREYSSYQNTVCQSIRNNDPPGNTVMSAVKQQTEQELGSKLLTNVPP